MRIERTSIKGVFIIRMDSVEDERGSFARVWCKEEFKKAGLNFDVVQTSLSFNRFKGTLRGLHYQAHPYEEAKLIWVSAGAVYDVALDLRRSSPTFGAWISVVLKSEDRKMIYISKGIAHGFLTLKDNTEVFYHISQFYRPEYAKGIRWNDPAFGVKWPIEVRVISLRDASFPDFEF